jgi:uncharacterized protein (DUF4415 family)
MRAVSNNPEWTKRDFEKAKAFDEVFPTMRKGRGPNKAPTKKLVSLRLSPVVLDHFKAGGPNRQSRIDDALVKISVHTGFRAADVDPRRRSILKIWSVLTYNKS